MFQRDALYTLLCLCSWLGCGEIPVEESAFQCSDDVYDMKIRGDSIICGLRNGTIEIWNRKTLKKEMSLEEQHGQVQVSYGTPPAESGTWQRLGINHSIRLSLFLFSLLRSMPTSTWLWECQATPLCACGTGKEETCWVHTTQAILGAYIFLVKGLREGVRPKF